LARGLEISHGEVLTKPFSQETPVAALRGVLGPQG